VHVAERTPGTRGLSIFPRRWVVERTLSWISRTRRMSKDDEWNGGPSFCVGHGVVRQHLVIQVQKLAKSTSPSALSPPVGGFQM
jgi:transposase